MANPATAKGTKPKSRGPPLPVRIYLVLFNLVSFFLWTLILSTTLKHLILGPQTPSIVSRFTDRTLASFRPLRIFMIPTYSRSIPEPFLTLLNRSANLHSHIGGLLCFTQSLAILEVVHAAIGFVRSPVITTALQVASRLTLTWAVAEKYHSASTSPWFTAMVLAWSITEAIRYPFYANGLMGSDSPGLTWARYTTFYILYPIGAASEAACMWATLPAKWFWEAPKLWGASDYVFLFLFAIWWPGLYVMYTHMIKQRRKAIGKGFWGDKAVEAKKAEQRARLQAAASKNK